MAAGAAWLALRGARAAVRERIVLEAKNRGFELAFADASIEGERVVLREVTARPLGVRGVAARLSKVEATLAGLDYVSLLLGRSDEVELVALEAEGAQVQLLGSAPGLALELSQWSERYPAAYDMKAEASNVTLSWRAAQQEAPWATIEGGSVTRAENGGRFEAARANVLGRPVGPVGSRWSKETGKLALDLGAFDAGVAPVHVEIQLDEANPTATFELRPTPLSALSGPLGTPLPLETVTVTAKATLKLPPGLAPAPVPGSVHLELLGYVPPHPPELDGFVFGDRTVVDTELEVAADQKSVKLENTRVTAGAFALQGDGDVQRAADHARARMRLTGSLPCVALATAAADTRLGQHWASFTKQMVKKNLVGSVTVTVNLDADTRDLSSAKLLRSVGLGCGLKPLRLPTAAELAEFSTALPGLIEELPKLPLELPKLPAGLPPLPKALPSALPGLLPSALPPLPERLPKLPVPPEPETPKQPPAKEPSTSE